MMKKVLQRDRGDFPEPVSSSTKPREMASSGSVPESLPSRSVRMTALVLVLMVTACAPMMVAPPGPSATLTFATTATSAIGIFHPVGPMDRYRCSKDKPEGIGTLNNIALGGGRKTQRFDVLIPASGERFRFFAPIAVQGRLIDPATQRYEYRMCIAHEDFLPQAGMHYLVDVKVDTDRCAMDIKRVESDGRPVEEQSWKILPACYPQGMVSSMFEKGARENYERNPDLYR